MGKQLTAEDVEELRKWEMKAFVCLHYGTQRQIVEHMLHLHDTIQRLQTLQPKDVTLEELAAVNDEVPVLVVSSVIAAVCRGMLREVGGNE